MLGVDTGTIKDELQIATSLRSYSVRKLSQRRTLVIVSLFSVVICLSLFKS